MRYQHSARVLALVACLAAPSIYAQTYSAWPASATPATASAGDTQAIEVGVKFRVTQNGLITGLRFYKGSANTGTHTGTLWSSTGALLARATFSNETASGWQQVNFAAPVAVSANTTYVASYYAPAGRYSKNESFFGSAVTNGPIRLLSSGEDGPNGVYRYGSSGFPSSSYNASNYWVDVVFTTAVVPPPPPPGISSSLFPSTAPVATTGTDADPVELGVKFSPAVNGTISAVRFYKHSANNGTHVGNLWTAAGALLARATFTSETASGWQQVSFTTPVSVAAGQTYVASYFAPAGRYSKTENFFASAFVNGNLRAAANSESGNGVFRYNSSTGFPTSSYNATNYWVDVVFTPGTQQPVPVSVVVSPPTASLSASQTQQFTATVTGTANTAVTWSLSPAAGTVSAAGLYTAPASISAGQTVTVTATSAADSTKKATASVTLRTTSDTTAPTISINSPSSGATVTGTAALTASAADNVAVVGVQFRVDGVNAGSELTSAPYTMPWNSAAVANGAHGITATARDAAGNTRTASVSVNVSNAAQSRITLPVEVFGPVGTTRSVPFTLPAGTSLTGARLWLQLHGYNYPDKGAVKVNNSAWIVLNDSTISLDPMAAAYGGIGGGFGVLKMQVSLPAGALVNGANTVQFRFDKNSGSFGFRVLRFNIIGANSAVLLGPEAFVQEDPNTWTAPRNTPADIAEGKRLFQQGDLISSLANPVPIRARCGDCHAQDGRDLKYFNYSNVAIWASATSHGLTSTQGDQIASYIRSLNVPNPGRPWNPVYQPGPGLDAKPVAEWSAGAGIDAVLDEDKKTIDAIAMADYPHTANLNARETPIALQLPDWNHWLPKVHPKDAWGDSFLNSDFFRYYGQMRSGLRLRDVNSFKYVAANQLAFWEVRRGEFIATPGTWTATERTRIYGASQWMLVKLWEMMHEFELQEFGREMFGPQAEQRSWYDHAAFLTSPNMLHMPAGSGLLNGTTESWIYFSHIWYQLQLILNNSNKRQSDNNPLDWPYVYGFIKSMGEMSPQAGVQTLFMIKAMQISENGRGPEIAATASGWQWRVNDISRLVHSDFSSVWTGVSQAQRAQVFQTLVHYWLQKVKTFTPQQFYAGGSASSSETVGSQMDGSFGDRIWYSVPRLKYYGVNQMYIDDLTNWARTVWPNNNWTSLRTVTCSQGGDRLHCSND